MTIEWKVSDNKIIVDEGQLVDYVVEYTPSNCKMNVLSSTLPTGISVVKYDGYIKISGEAPQVSEDTSYYVTLRLTEYNDTDEVIDVSDNYFEILVKTLPLAWDESETTDYELIVYTEFNKQLKLLHANGNEVYKKVAGELPYGVSLSSSGVLYGSINGISETDQTYYQFTVDVFVNGKSVEPSLKRDFSLTIKNADSETAPHWLTEAGNIGSISFNEISKFKLIAYDMVGDSTLSYELDKTLDSHYRLPPGLSLNNMTGEIEGALSVSQYFTYEFGVKASKLVNGKQIYSETRVFSITANDVSKEHRLIWDSVDTLDLGKYIVGNEVVGYVPSPYVEDGTEIKFYLGSGDIPQGLILNENGTFGGILEYQEIRDYYFTIIAETKYVSVTKNVVMHLGKGLGSNAIKMYLRINNEYRDEYINLKSQFNPNTAYKSHNSNFVVDTFPKIDVAVLTCYDRELLSHMINFGNPVIIRFKGTESLIHSQINNFGEPIENYEVIYKAIDESTYQWEDLNIGDYDFNSKLANMKENQEIEDSASLDFNNDVYNSGATNPVVSYNVFNLKNFRDLLSQKIYVYRMNGTYYYSVGSQELFDMERINGVYYLYKQVITKPKKDENKIQITNTTPYSINITEGKQDEVEYKLINIDPITEEEEDKVVYKISNSLKPSEDDIVVEYRNGNVYQNGICMTDCLFNVCEFTEYGLVDINTSFVKFDENGDPYYLKSIVNPICFNREKNTNIVLYNIPTTSIMVLPMITEDDLHYDESDTSRESPYIKFLDTEVEQLPEWKRAKPTTWTPYTQFTTGEVIINNSVYYECLQQFRSGEKFVEDKNLLKVLTNEEVNMALSKSYFPTLDLGYYEVNTNRYYLNQVRTKEANGEFWYNKDFLFYEVVCEPLFNNGNEKFCVWFKKQED